MLSKRLNAIARESTAVSLAIESFAAVVLSLPLEPPLQAVESANSATVKIGMIFFMGDYIRLIHIHRRHLAYAVGGLILCHLLNQKSSYKDGRLFTQLSKNTNPS